MFVTGVARIPLTRQVRIPTLHSDPTFLPENLFVHFPFFKKMFSSTALGVFGKDLSRALEDQVVELRLVGPELPAELPEGDG